jgi:hypothetical protein
MPKLPVILLSGAAIAALAGCDYPNPDQPGPSQASLQAPMQMPVPAPAVPRATDAGAQNEAGPLETR